MKTNTTSNFYDIKKKLCFAFDFYFSFVVVVVVVKYIFSATSNIFNKTWKFSLSHKKYCINEWMRRINLHNNFHFHDEDFFSWIYIVLLLVVFRRRFVEKIFRRWIQTQFSMVVNLQKKRKKSEKSTKCMRRGETFRS